MTSTEDDIVLKLLHTADWHLGRRFRSFSEEASLKLSRARLEVLDRIFNEAERHAVDAVLCAGDLFDEPNPSSEWSAGLADCLARRKWTNRPVFLLPGNHDPLLQDSVWFDPKFRRALPAWAHVIEAPGEFALANGCVLHAVPCESRAGQLDPTAKIPSRAPGDERVRIGMVHGSTFDAPNAQTNFPIAKDAAVERGLDYLALGDTHGFRFIPPERKQPPTIYPGAPEPTAFDERDPGSVAIVFISRQRRAMVTPRRVASWDWEEVAITSMAQLRQLVARQDLKSRVLRVTVDLSVSAPELDEAERLIEQLGGNQAVHGMAGVLDLRRDRLELDVSNLSDWSQTLPQVLQTTVQKLQTVAHDPLRRPVAQRALFHLFRSTRKAS
ncbi:MAG: DNA repair exonuclease [Myxococcaceae bacterium]|nr:DNA repair exonuclease [Myxococcaceae bacterium]